MAWVAVDYNGDEYIYDNKPEKSGYLTYNPPEDIYGEFIGSMIELTKGTIKKLIGRDLTWEDEPVEI